MTMRPIAGLAMTAITSGVAHAGPATSTFLVQMTVVRACMVSAAPLDIDLGSVAARTGTVNYSGSTTIGVNCSKKTPFFIGLAPSNGNTGGRGTMGGATTGNTNKVPYRLYSNAALTRPWGNKATSTRRGNGVAGTGKGMAAAQALSFSAYAQVTTVNFRSDAYADTVTVNVHY
jgi:spore coat protein U-like protein